MDSSGKRFGERVVLVTGASSGFGLATARAFAREGAKVVLTARNAERLAKAAQELADGGTPCAMVRTCDVTRSSEVREMVDAVIQTLGRVDILVNNAGSGLIAPIERIRSEDAMALFQTNFFGAFHCIQAVLPHMKKQGGGQIMNMASVAGLRGIPNSSMYCASKAALIAFSESLRIEVKQHGISVTVLCPSRTNDTRFVQNAKTYGAIELYKVPDSLTTEMVVDALLDAAVRRKPMVILPFHAWLLHTLNKFAPRVLDRILLKRMPKLESTP